MTSLKDLGYVFNIHDWAPQVFNVKIQKMTKENKPSLHLWMGGYCSEKVSQVGGVRFLTWKIQVFTIKGASFTRAGEGGWGENSHIKEGRAARCI